MAKPQLLICGSIAVDRIMSFEGRYKDLIKPDKLDVLSLSPLLSKLENLPGGIGANIAYNLARLGEEPVLLGAVGPDSQTYIQSLKSAGVDTSHIYTSSLATASFNVITDSDGNQVGGFYPGAMGDSQAVSFSPWKAKNVLAVVSAHDPAGMNRQVLECHNLGIRLVYDPGQQVSAPETDLAAGLRAAEVVLVNEYERTLLCERLGIDVQELAAKVPLVITTFGKNGSEITGSTVPKALRISIATPNQVIDPTGAGDGFRAGFLYGYIRQWDLQHCGQLGSTIASFIVEGPGTQQIYSKEEVAQRYASNFNQEVEL